MIITLKGMKEILDRDPGYKIEPGQQMTEGAMEYWLVKKALTLNVEAKEKS